MAQTSDHRAQICYRDAEVQLGITGATTVVSAPGGMRYSGAAFQLLDGLGQYDPRTAATLTHATLYDMPHVLNGNGPVLNAAYKTVTYYASAFVNTETWWTSSNQTIKLSSHSFVYAGTNYTNPTTETWTLYDGSSGNNVLHKVTDQMSYAGVNELARSRTYQ